ncbi:hypothetical protein [Natronosalvus rutilus]|uniref:Uncharacterized protein n=1 Tax=Natronosalvus rutilus TaxID=2953753 RepID=A0A9E7NFB7_9EURY|nr:hypothetical protein [Natronosalvus rutilus]UTF55954.1 hypothetical protein NGM29_20905 [Natronosalvus rutilus]
MRGNRPDDEPDESVRWVREIELFDSAEDIKKVRFIGDEKTVDVGITDDVMVDFLEAAEEVFAWIHEDMDEINRISRGDLKDHDETDGEGPASQ